MKKKKRKQPDSKQELHSSKRHKQSKTDATRKSIDAHKEVLLKTSENFGLYGPECIILSKYNALIIEIIKDGFIYSNWNTLYTSFKKTLEASESSDGQCSYNINNRKEAVAFRSLRTVFVALKACYLHYKLKRMEKQAKILTWRYFLNYIGFSTR